MYCMSDLQGEIMIRVEKSPTRKKLANHRTSGIADPEEGDELPRGSTIIIVRGFIIPLDGFHHM